MERKVIIAHAKGEVNEAERLEAALRAQGYDVFHRGTLYPGDSYEGEFSVNLSHEYPVVFCGTCKAAGSNWATAILYSAKSFGTRVFPVRLDKEAKLDYLFKDEVIEDCAGKKFVGGIQRLCQALDQFFAMKDAPPGSDSEITTEPIAFLDELTNESIYNEETLRSYRRQLRPRIRTDFPDTMSNAEFLRNALYMRKGMLTRCGALLFTDRPHSKDSQLLTAKIRCVIYHGTTKQAARGDRKEIEGPVLHQISQAYDFVAATIDKLEWPSRGETVAKTVYKYPMNCVREIIANAICHRAYDDTHRMVYVRIFTDHIQVSNPGTWTSNKLTEGGEEIALSELAGESVSPNFRLAHAIASVNVMEMEGSGIPSAVEDCRTGGARVPLVAQRDGYVVVKIYPKSDWANILRSITQKIEVESVSQKDTVFISYSHKDEMWKNKLLLHLKALEQSSQVVVWDDRRVDTGASWYAEITKAMDRAVVAICLITPDYLNSDLVNKEEIPFLLKRRDSEGMLLLPILVRPCLWKALHWLSNTQMLPRDGKSLEEIRGRINQEKALSEIAEHVYEKITDPDFQLSAPTGQWAHPEKVDIDRLPQTGMQLFGRQKEVELLDKAWQSDETRVVSLVAWGGVGKSTLVNKWLELMEVENYRGAKRVFGWSFYSQGTGERVTSADKFISEALDWFGDPEMADSKSSPWDKGKRLAELMQQQKTLLILDGLEPLQSDYEHDKGQVKDPALGVLLKQLAKANAGLCVITTREWLTGVSEGKESIIQKNLEQISPEAGRALLRVNGVRGTDAELEQNTRDFGCHALAVNLLVAYLQDATDRHIRNAALIADLDIPEKDGKHPRRIMQALANRFGPSPELNVLHIMGLFDRPASAKETNWLRTREEVPDLTDRIRWLTDDDWNRVIMNLRHFRLIAPESHHNRGGIDAHPHVREHFGKELKEINEESFKQGHSHLYEFLKMSAPKFPDTLEEMEPLFAAVSHGCLAGRHQETLDDVYYKRIRRGAAAYSVKRLGAFGADLAAVSCFFERPWSKPASSLSDENKALVLNYVGYTLRALGRLREAAEPMKAALELRVKQEAWGSAAKNSGNLSELYLTLGDVPMAVKYARKCINLVDKTQDILWKAIRRTTLANVLHQSGELKEAKDLFEMTEEMQIKVDPEYPDYPYLYSLRGFWFCDLLSSQSQYKEVQKRANKTLKWVTEEHWLLDMALDKLSLGRAYLIQASLGETGDYTQAADFLNRAVDGLRKAAMQEFIVHGLLARAELHRYQRSWEKAWTDLEEAREIAQRGEMDLYLADYHLESARLSLAEGKKPEARKHYEEAAKRVDDMGYHRRDPEVLLIQAELEIVDGDEKRARETLAKAKKLIDEMGCHRWDIEVERLKELLKKATKAK